MEKAPRKRLQALARSRPDSCAHSSWSTVPRRASCETLSALPRRRLTHYAPCLKAPAVHPVPIPLSAPQSLVLLPTQTPASAGEL